MEKLLGRHLGKSEQLINDAEAKMALAEPGFAIVWIGHNNSRTEIVKKVNGCQVTLAENDDRWTVTAANIKEGIDKAVALQMAVGTILERGRCYVLDAERITLHVWHKDINVVENIKTTYGGNYYRHGSGFLYACSNRKILKQMWRAVAPRIRDFENSRLTLLGDVE